jgi:hypothetical protein
MIIISGGEHQNVRFENNLVKQDGDLPVIATVSHLGVTYSNNIWSKTPYPAASGPGDVIADPLLVKIGNPYSPDWFILSETSPAIDPAITMPETRMNFFSEYQGKLLI